MNSTTTTTATTPYYSPSLSSLSISTPQQLPSLSSSSPSLTLVITMRDRSKNRKPLQRGRNLSIEAIQTVQALKRARSSSSSLQRTFDAKFKRLLKLDMVAVLRELLRQNECVLALKVFEDIRNELWYKAQVSLYAEIIEVLSTNGMFEQVKLLFLFFKNESNLLPDLEGFNALLKTFIRFSQSGLAMECYYFMIDVGCEPDRLTFKILINGLESMGEKGASAVLRQDAHKMYGGSLHFLEEDDENIKL